VPLGAIVRRMNRQVAEHSKAVDHVHVGIESAPFSASDRTFSGRRER
jgi:hypothetical protein